MMLWPVTAWSANASIALLSLGILLIYVELNRPGRILPGAVGLLITLLCIARIVALGPGIGAVCMIAAAIALFLLQLWFRTPLVVGFAATAGVIAGFRAIPAVHLIPALVYGLILGAGTSLLTHIARRARANKAVN